MTDYRNRDIIRDDTRRVRDASGKYRSAVISDDGLRRFLDYDMLSDEGMWAGALALLDRYCPGHDSLDDELGLHDDDPTYTHLDIALFSTIDVNAVARQNRINDELFAYRAGATKRYWEKSIWIIMLHAHGHYTLSIVFPRERKIRFFDSIASEDRFRADIAVSSSFAFRVLLIMSCSTHWRLFNA